MTHGDASKAKQLIDLLHHRVHAGDHRIATGMGQAREKNNRLNKGIVLSLSDFVHRLHDAGGKGRYDEKISQTMTVVATSVSQAAMYAKVPVKDVANALGLYARLISKCQERFNALANDGEIECLFDDRCAVRSDLLDEEWVKHALYYWTDPDLGFVRCSEKMSDAIRDPNNRKAPKQRLYSLETRIGDMYDAMQIWAQEVWRSVPSGPDQNSRAATVLCEGCFARDMHVHLSPSLAAVLRCTIEISHNMPPDENKHVLLLVRRYEREVYAPSLCVPEAERRPKV